MSRNNLTKAERRRVGRAIRKARREQNTQLTTIDWRAVREAMRASADMIVGAFAALGQALASIDWAAIGRALREERQRREAEHRDWMLTHRSLTTGEVQR